ncbi:MAG: ISNCY family transposase, partial [Cyanobacteriota bacterium]
ERLRSGGMTQAEGAERLGLSVRQVRRLLVRTAVVGMEGLRSGPRGGNRAMDPVFKDNVLSLITTNYHDFGPTLAAEKLQDLHNISISKETVRLWMKQAGLRTVRPRRKRLGVHQSRQPRPCFGELIQIDGSYHDWFEGRSAPCCLLVFIDDATSAIVFALFCDHETTLNYMAAVRGHLGQNGRPLAYYSDRHSIFLTTRNVDGYYEKTQFSRAMEALGIATLCAHSPQAKGRVERANKTLQDRLIKDMRLAGIDTIHAGNAFLKSWIPEHNQRFARAPADPHNAHRPVIVDDPTLDRILSIQETRKVSKNLEFSFNNQMYQIQTTRGRHLQHATITVCQTIDGEILVYYKNQRLNYTAAPKKTTTLVATRKEAHQWLNAITTTNRFLPTTPQPPQQRAL